MKKDHHKKMSRMRARIDDLDAGILKLLAERGRAAHEIGTIKKSEGLQVYVPAREKQIFARIQELNSGPYSDAALFAIYREIISATRALEQPTRVAFLGPNATFTHVAGVAHFGSSACFLPMHDIAEVFAAVEKDLAEYGVVPIENSTEGIVNYTLDKFVDSPLKICSEVIQPVVQNLLAKHESLQAVKTVYSHPQALAQCRRWLNAQLPGVTLQETESTARAAEIAAKNKTAAAIASNLAADLYGLNRLAAGIQDESQNFTRFLVIGQTEAERTGQDKTSIAFTAKHKSGSLHAALKPFAEFGVNLTKIESRPLKSRAWNYMFFVDLEGHRQDAKTKKALAKLEEHCEMVKILGSYPRSAWRGRS